MSVCVRESKREGEREGDGISPHGTSCSVVLPSPASRVGVRVRVGVWVHRGSVGADRMAQRIELSYVIYTSDTLL